MSARTRGLQRLALRIDRLSHGQITHWARRLLGEARFVTLTGAEGHARRDLHGSLPVSAGNCAPDAAGRDFPLTLLVLTGASAPFVEQVAKALSAAQKRGAHVRPVFVLDSGDFAPARSHGFVVDSVLSAGAHARASRVESYDAYLSAHTDLLARSYGSTDVRMISPGRTSALDDLLGRHR